MNVKLLVFLSLSVFTSSVVVSTKPASAQLWNAVDQAGQWASEYCQPIEKCERQVKSVWRANEWIYYNTNPQGRAYNHFQQQLEENTRLYRDNAKGHSSNGY